MTVCVTGATGYVGAHVAAGLARDGKEVRVTFRDQGRLDALAGVDVEAVEADALDREAMRKALEGCEILFHTTGLVASQPRERVWQINAVAPRIAVECAADAGVRRVVVTSSVAGVGPAADDRPADERNPYRATGLGLTYPDAKREGELAALAAGERLGVEVVSVNPSYVLGVPLNRALVGETSARIVANYLRGRLPGIVNSYTNIVDVEDVAHGHLLAAELGRPGERYILGGRNLRWPEVIERVAKLAGRRSSVIVFPPQAAATANLVRHLPVPVIPLEGVRLMAPDWRYSSAKAKRELGYEPRPVDETLRRTVDWCLELIEAGRFDKAPRSSFDVMSAAVRVSERLGLLLPLKGAGQLAGRKLVL